MIGRGYRAGLYNAPPTLSSMGELDRHRAIMARDRQNRAAWLDNRTPRPGFLARIFGKAAT